MANAKKLDAIIAPLFGMHLGMVDLGLDPTIFTILPLRDMVSGLRRLLKGEKPGLARKYAICGWILSKNLAQSVPSDAEVLFIP